MAHERATFAQWTPEQEEGTEEMRAQHLAAAHDMREAYLDIVDSI